MTPPRRREYTDLAAPRHFRGGNIAHDTALCFERRQELQHPGINIVERERLASLARQHPGPGHRVAHAIAAGERNECGRQASGILGAVPSNAGNLDAERPIHGQIAHMIAQPRRDGVVLVIGTKVLRDRGNHWRSSCD